jgi:hypothetical protein
MTSCCTCNSLFNCSWEVSNSIQDNFPSIWLQQNIKRFPFSNMRVQQISLLHNINQHQTNQRHHHYKLPESDFEIHRPSNFISNVLSTITLKSFIESHFSLGISTTTTSDSEFNLNIVVDSMDSDEIFCRKAKKIQLNCLRNLSTDVTLEFSEGSRMQQNRGSLGCSTMWASISSVISIKIPLISYHGQRRREFLIEFLFFFNSPSDDAPYTQNKHCTPPYEWVSNVVSSISIVSFTAFNSLLVPLSLCSFKWSRRFSITKYFLLQPVMIREEEWTFVSWMSTKK